MMAQGRRSSKWIAAGHGGLRTYVFTHTTNRIDVELGARLFRHLIALPIAYFESRRAGDSVARVHELENIQNFITSSALTLVIDLGFTFVFLAVMFYYSSELTWIVVVVSLLCGAVRRRNADLPPAPGEKVRSRRRASGPSGRERERDLDAEGDGDRAADAAAHRCDAAQTDRRLRSADEARRFNGLPAWAVTRRINALKEKPRRLRRGYD